jgi:hypothetical protein
MVMLTLYQNDKGACVLERRAILVGSAHGNRHEPSRVERFGPARAGMVDPCLQPSKPNSKSTNQTCEESEVNEWQ